VQPPRTGPEAAAASTAKIVKAESKIQCLDANSNLFAAVRTLVEPNCLQHGCLMMRFQQVANVLHVCMMLSMMQNITPVEVWLWTAAA